jgi:RNA polymerase sigma factor (TIGR02999 family)
MTSDHPDEREEPPVPGDVTRLLQAWQGGDRIALEKLIPLVYGELHRIAQRQLERERPGHTLQPSAIVNETYLKLVDNPVENLENRAHFFGVASRLMRQILVDHARRRAAQKRGGGDAGARLETVAMTLPKEVDVLAVDEALQRLAALDAEQTQIVELRFFGGLTVDESAEALGISRATVNRKWASARAWLHRELTGPAG